MNTSPAMTELMPPLASRGRPVDCECAATEKRYSALMRATQDGNCAAYSALLHAILPLLQRLVRSRLRFLQAADREDLVQEILLSIHAARASYDPKRPYMPWLMSIAHRRMVDRARRSARQRARDLLVDDFGGPIADQPLNVEESEYGDPEALHRALKELPARQRTAIELVKLRELSVNEASEISGVGHNALRVSVHRAIKRLRNSLA
jgi:RNA polymerase sigma-70 factor (ECF subfamily)